MFVNNTYLYCWTEALKTVEERFAKIQEETNAWGDLPITTEGCLKPKKWFWYLIGCDCVEGVWKSVDTSSC